MKFYIKEYGEALLNQKEYPCVVLTTDEWNDYSIAQTLFHARYYEKSDRLIYLNEVKIMHDEEHITRNIIPTYFEQLDDKYCSLGQNASFYELLRDIKEKDRNEILKGLNDAAIHDKYREKYENHSYFYNSLIRFSEASKVLDEAKNILNDIELIKENYEFSFSCKLKGSDTYHDILFDFKESMLPHRINVFVGKNATGKTSILNEIAQLMSGVHKKNDSEFKPKRPPFSKIITISYSAFDEMYKPFNDDSVINSKQESNINLEQNKHNKNFDENKLFSYIYCGLRTSNGLLEIKEMEMNFWRSYGKIKKLKRLDTWVEILSNIFEKDYLNKIEEISKDEIQGKGFSNELSSGQNILLYTMSEVIANIQPQSLLMFDEPETHLHPNAVANFMRLFYTILSKFDSYAIVSTHSPLIMQEIPSKYVHIFNRYGNSAFVEKPQSEFFGENISNITNDLFEVQEHESNYKTFLKSMLNDLKIDEIIDLFEDELSFNALTYLNSLEDEVNNQ